MNCPTDTPNTDWKQIADELAACVRQMRDCYWWDKTVPLLDADTALAKYENLNSKP